MTIYHLYFLRNGQLLGADKIEAADDREAGRIASERADGQIVEVWDAHRRVRVVAPALAAVAGRTHGANFS